MNFFKHKLSSAHSLAFKPSVVFFIFSICFAFWFNDLLKKYSPAKNETNFTWDGLGYYSYLPSIFYYNGTFEFEYKHAAYLPLNEEGKRYTKYPYGVALMELPFFSIAAIISKSQNQPVNGFSPIFADYVRLGNIMYVLIGFYLLRKFLLNFFNELTVAITLFSALFGSMLYMYTFMQSEISHGYLFTLFCVFMYYTLRWHQNPKWNYMLILSVVIGLISITRFTEIYIVFIFAFWNIKSIPDLKNKVQLILKHRSQFLFIPLIVILFWIPQMMYWKEFLGAYFTNPYVGEKFYWLDPQIINILFSYRKGWLLYTPIALLGLLGIVFIKNDFPVSKYVFLILISVLIYVFSCWWDWAYGGCFGNRAFCQLIAVLCIPIASLLDYVLFKLQNYKVKNVMCSLVLFYVFSCSFLNLQQSFQFQTHGLLHTYNMSKDIYWGIFREFHYDQTFFKTYPSKEHQRNYDAWKNGLERDDR